MPEAIKSSSTPASSRLPSKQALASIESLPAVTIDPSPLLGDSAPVWSIYRIKRLSDGRSYVGVTKRALAMRTAAHDLTARLRPRLGRAGSLAEAIRHAYSLGGSFAQDFTVELLAQTSDCDQARILERLWITRLNTAAPNGFNLMPGGSSLGGPVNAEAISFGHPVRGAVSYTSVMDALVDINRERTDQRKPHLLLGSVYARLAMGWPPTEALELAPHHDRRRTRPLFRWHGRTYNTIEELARFEGLRIDTIRSRLYRARRAGCGPNHDVAQDRRLSGAQRTGGRKCGPQAPLVLPHPLDPLADPVDAQCFARLADLPHSTVLHRYQRLVERSGSAELSRAEVLAALMHEQDRRLIITLPLPNGSTISGGVREVIRRTLDDAGLKWGRPERLGESAIRARLRRIPGWPETLSAEAVKWAFGFCPQARPTSAEAPTTD